MYPLLTLAQEVCDKQILKPENLHFIIADNNADFRYFESNNLYKNFTYSKYSVAKLRRYFSWQNFIDFFIFFKNIIKSFSFLVFNRPDKIFSKGGFVSLPFGISAFFLRIPFFLHETDSAMGLSNRILSVFAKKIFTGFPLKTKNSKYIFIGNPVRAEFFDIPKGNNLKTLHILIFGGSQGAKVLNEWAREFFNISKNKELENVLTLMKKNIEVLIISGKNKSNAERINKITEINNNFLSTSEYKIFVKEVEFLTSDFVQTIHNSDIVIARAGGSIAELAAAQKCTVLVPLPTSANNHQQKNADYFTSENAVLQIQETDLHKKETYKRLNELFSSEKQQKNLSNKLTEFARPHVVENLIKELELQ